jgi:soluble lytic murein transglycosylase
LPAVSAPPPAVVREAPDAHRVATLVRFLEQKKRTGLSNPEIRALAHEIAVQAERHGFDVGLVLAVIHVESRYNNFAVSPVGAMGLMQILPTTGEELAFDLGIPWRGPHTLFDPRVNVLLGTAYLRQLTDRYRGDISMALAAYNWGPGHIDRRLRRGTPMPTEYTGLVMQALDRRVAGRS